MSRTCNLLVKNRALNHQLAPAHYPLQASLPDEDKLLAVHPVCEG